MMMEEEEERPSSPPDSPPINHSAHNNNQPDNLINNMDFNDNNMGQLHHLRTLYQLRNMLTRQYIQQGQPQNNSNDHIAINLDGTNNNTTNNLHNNTNNSSGNNNTNSSVNNSSSGIGGSNPNSGESIVAAAGVDGSRVDLQLVTGWLEQSLPFLLLLALTWVYHHRNGILAFAWACVLFINANQTVKKQVALKEKRSSLVLGLVAVGLLFHIFLVYFYFREEELYRYLVFLPPRKHLVIWDTFWAIVMNDFVVRYATMIVKCVVIITRAHIPPHKRNTQLYSLIESFSNAYRTVLPMSLWFKYMFKAADVFSNLISLMYLLAKFNNFYERCASLYQAFRAYVLREVQYGKYASSEQVMEAGDQCTICQEKMSSPIVLHCNHIFCEDCVSEWFEREKTCPLCRAQVPTAGNRSHSDGTTSLLVQLF